MYEKLSEELNALIFSFGEELLSKPVVPTIPVFDSFESIEDYVRDMFHREYRVPSHLFITRDFAHNDFWRRGSMPMYGNRELKVYTSVGPIQVYIKF